MQLKKIMHSVTKVPSDMNISEAARIMGKKLIGSVLIEEDGKVIGIMTERDILQKIVAKGINSDEVKVNEIMNSPIITIDGNKDVTEASRIMDEHKMRRMVITEDDQIVGIVTVNSIAKNVKYLLAKDTSVYTRPEY